MTDYINDMVPGDKYLFPDGSIMEYRFIIPFSGNTIAMFHPIKLNKIYEFTESGYIPFEPIIFDSIIRLPNVPNFAAGKLLQSGETIASAEDNVTTATNKVDNKQNDNMIDAIEGLVTTVLELRNELKQSLTLHDKEKEVKENIVIDQDYQALCMEEIERIPTNIFGREFD